MREISQVRHAVAVLHAVHSTGAWVLAALALGHAGAALFHHFVLRDDVLACMAPVVAKTPSGKPAITAQIPR